MMTPAAGASSDASSSTNDKWDRVAEALECQGGMAVVNVPLEVAKVHAHAFQVARRSLDQESHHNVTIPPDADSAHVTGYHPPGEGMSRYNAFREGFVFSDGNLIGDNDNMHFQRAMHDMFVSLHNNIAQHVLSALERRWNLAPNWFQNSLGPTENHSQWHIKRYVYEYGGHGHDDDSNDLILLPVHTDPSLISIVVHDREAGTTTTTTTHDGGAMGLQYQFEGEWRNVPVSGHDVAIIFVGSVLSYITGNVIPAAKHRVVTTNQGNGGGSARHLVPERMAATLFVRPRGTAVLQVPPSCRFENVTLKKTTDFHAWSSRVSKHYMKKKKKQREKA